MHSKSEVRYPLGTSSFERIRTENMLYVDKTAYIAALVDTYIYVFLARPRRFGKSVLISTIEQYFLGNKVLFEGLEIEHIKQKEWTARPVLHLDLTGVIYDKSESLLNTLESSLNYWKEKYDVIVNGETIGDRFFNLIQNIFEKHDKRIVILVDEYDTPLTSAIDNPELQSLFQEQLHGFYSVLKKADKYIEFCMLTGVSRFGKVSVFSGLNNLNDITFDDRYAGICGVTQEELKKYYTDGINSFANELKVSDSHVFDLLKLNYDGYHFSPCMLDVYNPYSINNALSNRKIKDYWCQSGLPTILSKSLLKIDYDFEKLKEMEVSEEDLSDLSIYNVDPLPLFYQTGYLTLKEYDSYTDLYKVGYPNREVENSILRNVLQVYVPKDPRITNVISKMRKGLESGNPEDFIKELKVYLAGIPSELRNRVANYENYYHTIFYCITQLIGMNVDAEHNTSEGFIDILIKTANYIYLIELKVNGNAQSAIEQIDRKHYALKFETDKRKLFKIGIGFSKKTGTIKDYIIR